MCAIYVFLGKNRVRFTHPKKVEQGDCVIIHMLYSITGSICDALLHPGLSDNPFYLFAANHLLCIQLEVSFPKKGLVKYYQPVY